MPVQQDVACAAGAGPGRLLVFVSDRVKPGEVFVADVVEASERLPMRQNAPSGRTT
ncbi:hypothetical protein [Streptomyces sp. H27-C3]|uniref:hypothetical protein n=1 Tax=Streptomyces sp. H27-C3 TaxID=3046305 RepID=UPI0024B96A3D|nr:hypothetical protein [Streptomyces sp. H27-C3]MDJ0466659.1 hypothetical protein [Streptomyces sp. H27-C3]